MYYGLPRTFVQEALRRHSAATTYDLSIKEIDFLCSACFFPAIYRAAARRIHQPRSLDFSMKIRSTLRQVSIIEGVTSAGGV